MSPIPPAEQQVPAPHGTQNGVRFTERGLKRIRLGRLKTAEDVRRYLARCIRRVEAGGDINLNYKLAVLASMLLKAVEISTLEERIRVLEERTERNGQLKRVEAGK